MAGDTTDPIAREKVSLNDFYARHERKFRFLVVGGVNTVFGVLSYPFLFYILDSLKLHYVVILLISQVICITMSYVTNKLWVFRTAGWPFTEYLRFAGYYGLYFLANLLLLPLAVEVLKQGAVESQIVISLASVFATYFWHSRITFVSKER